MPESPERRAGIAAARKMVLALLGFTDRGFARKLQSGVMMATRKLYSRLTAAEAKAIVQGVVPAGWTVDSVRYMWEFGKHYGDVVSVPHNMAQPAPMPVMDDGEEEAVLLAGGPPRTLVQAQEHGPIGQVALCPSRHEAETLADAPHTPPPQHGPASPALRRAALARRRSVSSSMVDSFEKDHHEQIRDLAMQLSTEKAGRQRVPLRVFKKKALWRLWKEADEDVRDLYKHPTPKAKGRVRGPNGQFVDGLPGALPIDGLGPAANEGVPVKDGAHSKLKKHVALAKGIQNILRELRKDGCLVDIERVIAQACRSLGFSRKEGRRMTGRQLGWRKWDGGVMCAAIPPPVKGRPGGLARKGTGLCVKAVARDLSELMVPHQARPGRTRTLSLTTSLKLAWRKKLLGKMTYGHLTRLRRRRKLWPATKRRVRQDVCTICEVFDRSGSLWLTNTAKEALGKLQTKQPGYFDHGGISLDNMKVDSAKWWNDLAEYIEYSGCCTCPGRADNNDEQELELQNLEIEVMGSLKAPGGPIEVITGYSLHWATRDCLREALREDTKNPQDGELYLLYDWKDASLARCSTGRRSRPCQPGAFLGRRGSGANAFCAGGGGAWVWCLFVCVACGGRGIRGEDHAAPFGKPQLGYLLCWGQVGCQLLGLLGLGEASWRRAGEGHLGVLAWARLGDERRVRGGVLRAHAVAPPARHDGADPRADVLERRWDALQVAVLCGLLDQSGVRGQAQVPDNAVLGRGPRQGQVRLPVRDDG